MRLSGAATGHATGVDGVDKWCGESVRGKTKCVCARACVWAGGGWVGGWTDGAVMQRGTSTLWGVMTTSGSLFKRALAKLLEAN